MKITLSMLSQSCCARRMALKPERNSSINTLIMLIISTCVVNVLSVLQEKYHIFDYLYLFHLWTPSIIDRVWSNCDLWWLNRTSEQIYSSQWVSCCNQVVIIHQRLLCVYFNYCGRYSVDRQKQRKTETLLRQTFPVQMTCVSLWNNANHTFVLLSVCHSGRSPSPCQLSTAIALTLWELQCCWSIGTGEMKTTCATTKTHTPRTQCLCVMWLRVPERGHYYTLKHTGRRQLYFTEIIEYLSYQFTCRSRLIVLLMTLCYSHAWAPALQPWPFLFLLLLWHQHMEPLHHKKTLCNGFEWQIA